jgi:hypothetical protein
MKKGIIGLIVVAALAVGVGGAYLVVKSLPETAYLGPNWDDFQQPAIPDDEGEWPFGWPGRGVSPYENQPGNRGRWGMGPGMNGGRDFGAPDYFGAPDVEGERITMDTALKAAQDYAAEQGKNLRVAEIMEFSENFYAVVVETDTGKGAFELLIDPVSAKVTPEFGPNLMWNTKYGHMSVAEPSVVNSLTMEQAAAQAQKALDRRFAKAKVSTTGIDFYGYYTFDYEIDGQTAGMLSVNGENGKVWFHNWHGDFIGEMEIKE